MLRGRKPYADPQSPIFSFITSQKDMDCPDIVLRLEGIGPKLLFYVQAYKCKPGTYWRAHLLVFVVLAVACMHHNFNFMGQILLIHPPLNIGTWTELLVPVSGRKQTWNYRLFHVWHKQQSNLICLVDLTDELKDSADLKLLYQTRRNELSNFSNM